MSPTASIPPSTNRTVQASLDDTETMPDQRKVSDHIRKDNSF